MRRALAPLALLALACSSNAAPSSQMTPNKAVKAPEVPAGHQVATLAGGCFWCMEAPFDKTPGVKSTTSGYTDGETKNPTYKQVGAGYTGHTEAIQVVFDPKVVSYAQLLELFWRNIDPLAKDRQFCDRGTQYRAGIYWHDAAQKAAAEASKATVVARFAGQTVHTEVKAATRFYPAEDYHQNFYQTNSQHYYRYRKGCGRDARLKALWGAAKP